MELECTYFDGSGGRCQCIKGDNSLCGCNPKITLPSVDQLISSKQLDRQDKRLERFRAKFCERNTALVLGAGISIPSGLPGWVDLVSKMMGHAIQYRTISENGAGGSCNPCIIELTQALIAGDLSFLSGVNTLESAQYVAQLFDDENLPDQICQQVPELAIKEMLLRMIDNSLTAGELLAKELLNRRPFTKDIIPSFSSSTMPDSILDEIARFPKDNLTKKDFAEVYEKIRPYINLSNPLDRRAVANLSTIFAVIYLIAEGHGVRQTMTYNYDPLVEEYLMGLFEMPENEIRMHSEKWNLDPGKAPDACEIFHVHGFVPGKRHRGAFPHPSDRLILSEDSYYDIEQNGVYNWSSSVQSNFLNRYNCIIVGFSAEDYNFKRILRQQGLDRMKNGDNVHCLLFTIDDLVRNTYKDVCRYHMRKEANGCGVGSDVQQKTKVLLQNILDCKEKYWKRFGILPVWTTIADLPGMLADFVPAP